jgi:hypothetical protein
MAKIQKLKAEFSYYTEKGFEVTKKFEQSKVGQVISIKDNRSPAVGGYEARDLDPCTTPATAFNKITGSTWDDVAIPGLHPTELTLFNGRDIIYWGKLHGNHVIKQEARAVGYGTDEIVLVDIKPADVDVYCTFLPQNGEEVMRIVDKSTGRYLTIDRHHNEKDAVSKGWNPNHVKWLKFEAEQVTYAPNGKISSPIYSEVRDISECSHYIPEGDVDALQLLYDAFYNANCIASDL